MARFYYCRSKRQFDWTRSPRETFFLSSNLRTTLIRKIFLYRNNITLYYSNNYPIVPFQIEKIKQDLSTNLIKHLVSIIQTNHRSKPVQRSSTDNPCNKTVGRLNHSLCRRIEQKTIGISSNGHLPTVIPRRERCHGSVQKWKREERRFPSWYRGHDLF